MTSFTSSSPARVVVAGGGVAGVETMLGLHEVAPDRTTVTWLTPDDFMMRPVAVAEPFALGHSDPLSLAHLAWELGADLVRDGLLGVVADTHQVVTTADESIAYDILVVATGARSVPAYTHALTFDDNDPLVINGLLRDIEEGYVKRVAFVVPPGQSWALPAYELALMTARQAWGMGITDATITLVTPEPAPLALFGPAAGAAVDRHLSTAGVEIVTSAYAQVERGHVLLKPMGRLLEVDRVVALPKLVGRRHPGLPADSDGFIPVDEHGQVAGLPDVFAAGDGTDFPIKQGGLAAQQADAVVRAIGARLGTGIAAEPFRPVLRGMLLTGAGPEHLESMVAGGGGEGRVTRHPLWWPPTKVAGGRLAGYLAAHGRTDGLAAHRPADAVPVDVPVLAAR